MLCRCPWRQKPESGDHCFKVSPVWENVKTPLSAGGWALIMEVRWISHKLLNILLKLLVATNHKTSGYTARCPAVSWGDVGQVAAGARTNTTTSTTSTLTIFIIVYEMINLLCPYDHASPPTFLFLIINNKTNNHQVIHTL